MPRKKDPAPLGVNTTPKFQSTQCNFFLFDQYNAKAKASCIQQTQTNIFGTIIPESGWNDLNAFVISGDCSKKRKLVDKETITEEVPVGKCIPALLYTLEEYITSLNIDGLQILYKKVNGKCEHIEVTLDDAAVPVSFYSDTPIKLLFSASGKLTILKIFKEAEEKSYINADNCSFNKEVVNSSLAMLTLKHVFCPGIPLSDCENIEAKGLVKVIYPFERNQAVDCSVWFVPPNNVSKDKLEGRIYQCGNCRALNWYINDQKKKKAIVTPERKLKRSSNSSRSIIKSTLKTLYQPLQTSNNSNEFKLETCATVVKSEPEDYVSKVKSEPEDDDDCDKITPD